MPQADACLEAEEWPHTWTAGCEACRAWRAHLHRGQQHAHTCTALSDKSIGKKCSSMDVPHQSTLSPPPPLSAKGWKNPTDPCEAFVEVIMLLYWGYNVAISQEPLPAGVQATPDAAKIRARSAAAPQKRTAAEAVITAAACMEHALLSGPSPACHRPSHAPWKAKCTKPLSSHISSSIPRSEMRLNSMLSQHGRVRIRSGNHARHQEGQVSPQGCVCSHNLRCNCPKALENFLQICCSNALRQTPHIKGFMGGIQLAGLAIHHGSESNLEAGTVHIFQVRRSQSTLCSS